MKLIKNVMDKKRLKCSIAVLMMVANNNFGMDAQQVSKTKIVLKRRRDDKEEESRKRPKVESSEMNVEQGKYFIYQEGTDNGIWVDKQFVKEQCKSLKDMLEDFGGENEPSRIPLKFPFEAIQLAFDILERKISISKLSFNELVLVSNIFNFLDVSQEIMNQVLNRLRKFIQEYGEKIVGNELVFKKLNYDIQKMLLISLVEQSVNKIAEKKVTDRKKIFKKEAIGNILAFSPNGKKILAKSKSSSSLISSSGLILWDISDFNNTLSKSLTDYPNTSVAAFSQDGTKMICNGVDQNARMQLGLISLNLILWDIRDWNNIKYKILNDNLYNNYNINVVEFSHDGTKIVFGYKGNQNNLILLDISDWNNIKYKTLNGHSNNVMAVAFSHDDTKIVSSSDGSQNNFILWDISDWNNIINKSFTVNLIDDQTKTDFIGIKLVAFSSDNKRLMIGSKHRKNNLMMWDISDWNNIEHKNLVGYPNKAVPEAFSFDGRKLVSKSEDAYSFALCDIDENHVTCQDLGFFMNRTISKISFSPDATKIIACSSLGSNDILIFWTLLDDSEKQLLQQLHNYTADQMRLIYLLLQRAQLQFKSNDEVNIFNSLPNYAQKALTNLLS